MSETIHKGAETNRKKAVERAEQVLSMRDRGLTYEDIGDSLGISTDVARQIVSRHKKRTSKDKPERKYRIKHA